MIFRTNRSIVSARRLSSHQRIIMRFWVLLPLLAAVAVALPAYPYVPAGSYLMNFLGPVQYEPEPRKSLQSVVGSATTATQSVAAWQLKQLRRKWVFIICMLDTSCPSLAYPDKHPWAPAATRSYPNQFRIEDFDEELSRSYPNQFRMDYLDEESIHSHKFQSRIDDFDEEPNRPYPIQFRIDDLAEEMQHREMLTPSRLVADEKRTPNRLVSNKMLTPYHLTANQMLTPNQSVANQLFAPNQLAANQMLTPNHLAANPMLKPNQSVANRMFASNQLAANQMSTPNPLVVDEMVKPNRLVADEMLTPNQLVANQMLTPNQLVANQMLTPNQLVANQMLTPNQLAANQMSTPNQLVANQMFTLNRLIQDYGKDSLLTNAITAGTNIRGVNKATSKLIEVAQFQMAQWMWRWNIILCFINPSCPHVNIPSSTARFGRQHPPIRVDVEKMRMMAETQEQPRVMFPVSIVRD